MLSLPSATTTRLVAATPADVWEVLVETRYWPRWGASVTAVEPRDMRIALGSSGNVRTPIGVWLPFRVTTFEEGRSWSWSIGGIPATSHLVERRPEGCLLSFDVPLLAWPYLLVCRDALRRIARIAERELRDEAHM